MKYKFGVSLSGGGYRAAAFHLGAIRYLQKAGILQKVECLSTVSGGSIIGAAYCLMIGKIKSFEEFELFLRVRLQKSIIKKILLSFSFIRLAVLILSTIIAVIYLNSFSAYPWTALVLIVMALALFVKFQFRLFPVSRIIEHIYNKMFYDKAMLPELTARPFLIINSTNLQSGRLFYFTRDNISDSTYDNIYDGQWKKVFKHEQFSVAKAVMCSSSVPSFFTPIIIGKELLIDPKDAEVIQPVLVDGGVYDNQGIHKLTHPKGQFECKTVIVSDAGSHLPLAGSYKNNIFTLLMRTVEVFMNRIKNFQMMANLYQNRPGTGKEIAYITLAWDIKDLIPGFVRNLRNGNVIEVVRNAHGLTDDFITKKSDQEISAHLAEGINFEEIKIRMPSAAQIRIARSVSTNLTALSKEQIDALSGYAEIMTEVQTKLYCPTLLRDDIA